MQWLSPRLLGYLAYGMVALISKTLRLSIKGGADLSADKNYLFVFWHGKQLLASVVLSKASWQVAGLVSASRDGEIMSTWLKCLGFDAIRGSSSRLAVSSLVSLIRYLKGGGSVGITPDGPKGPRYRAKPGVAYLALKTGVEVVPIGSAFANKWTAKSWDLYQIPKPFSQAIMVYGKPLKFSSEQSPEEVTKLIEAALNEVEEQAQTQVGH